MKSFMWCPEIGIQTCLAWCQGPHVHICIRSVGASVKTPQCGNPALYLSFHDLDPESIRKTSLYLKDPVAGETFIEGCFQRSQANRIAEMVAHTPDDRMIVVNCEAGVSRSPGVVLALRRHYGGDENDVFSRAVPNIYVTKVLTEVLKERAA